MKKYEKEVLQAQLDNEKAVLGKLEQNYQDALDEINGKIAMLLGRQDADLPHVIYQVQYQQMLKTQVQTILEQLQVNEFETVSEYLTHSYEEGFLGAMYSLQSQGVPFIFPIDQEQVVAAVQHETKLTSPLYKELGHDIKDLSKKIAGEISRGISTGAMYSDIARDIAGYTRIPLNRAMTITRTEAHRIQTRAAMDACEDAKASGADVVKQWDATLDGNTRPSHRKCDGEIRELDEKFSNGLMYPGEPGGRAGEVINCRCALLQRARWALNRTETKYLGNMDNMTDEELQPLADKLHMPVDELRTYQGQIVPINATSYDDFKVQYSKLSNYKGSQAEADAEARIAGYKKPVRSSGQKKKDSSKVLENNGNNAIIKVTRGQLDTGYSGKIPDDKLEEYNKKAFEQIKLDTGYSDEQATEFHNALLNYFGGDYETILSGETETAKIIKEGMSLMPTYDGAVYRGMTFSNEDIKMFSNLKPGDSLPQKGIIESWSSNERVAISFGGANDYYRSSIILECESNHTGVGVQHISKFGDREAEVLTSANYEVVEVSIENKYDYLSAHKELLYSPDDLDWVEDDVKENIVCRIKVKEKD